MQVAASAGAARFAQTWAARRTRRGSPGGTARGSSLPTSRRSRPRPRRPGSTQKQKRPPCARGS
eukprot:11165120-Lingulodinium_polyedra.AAC.1